jgi:hypothetical protein
MSTHHKLININAGKSQSAPRHAVGPPRMAASLGWGCELVMACVWWGTHLHERRQLRPAPQPLVEELGAGQRLLPAAPMRKPVGAPCTQRLRHGDPIHAPKEQLTAAAAPRTPPPSPARRPPRGGRHPSRRSRSWRARRPGMETAATRRSSLASWPGQSPGTRRRPGSPPCPAHPPPPPPAAVIESRWVSQPLAFAGELRPPRLNKQPHLHAPCHHQHPAREDRGLPCQPRWLLRRAGQTPSLHGGSTNSAWYRCGWG